MKKIISVLLIAILMVGCLVGCGEKRKLYSGVDLGKYVELNDYKGLKIDTESEEYKQYYENLLYKEIAEGTVENGDVINLDYSGKIDGVVFDGGTAQNQELVIGSGKFIDDFEEELIGAKIGETRDVTARFPDDYGKEELNGKEAVFTCKINGIVRMQKEEDLYKDEGFKSVDDYKKYLTEEASKSYIFNTVCNAAKVKNYPEADSNKMIEAIFEENVQMYKKLYNQDFEELLVASGYTIDSYKEEIKTSLLPNMMKTSMVVYYILDAEKLEVLESTVNSQETEQEVIAEIYAVQDTVLKYLYENAEIK